MMLSNSGPAESGPSYNSSTRADLRKGIGKYALNPWRTLTNAVLTKLVTQSRPPLGSQKKSTRGQSTLGLASPSQKMRRRTSRLGATIAWVTGSRWPGYAKWIIVISAGPFMLATTILVLDRNCKVSGFSIHKALMALVSPESTRVSSAGKDCASIDCLEAQWMKISAKRSGVKYFIGKFKQFKRKKE